MKILNVPHAVLARRAAPVKSIDRKIKRLVTDMITTLDRQTDPPGVGLAAPQVGLSLRLFIIKPTKKSRPRVFINPTIAKKVTRSKEQKTSNQERGTKKSKKPTKLEGCLSIPRIWGAVERAKKVLVEFADLNGRLQKKWFSGFDAVVIQHEMDHLDGVLFTQRVLEQKNRLLRERDGELEEYEI